MVCWVIFFAIFVCQKKKKSKKMYTTTPPTQLLCSCVRFDQGRQASQLCSCGQSVGRWCSKGGGGSVFSFFVFLLAHSFLSFSNKRQSRESMRDHFCITLIVCFLIKAILTNLSSHNNNIYMLRPPSAESTIPSTGRLIC